MHDKGDVTLDNSLTDNSSFDTGKKGTLPRRMSDNVRAMNTTDYDVPPTRNANDSSYNHSFNEQTNYDTLPSARNESGLNSSSFDQSVYDTPPTHKSYSSQPDTMYDVPPSGGEMYDVPAPSSNRSSILSNLSHLSNESTMTYSSSNFSNKSHSHNSNPASMCDSARSSMDISPQDFYDVPPSHQEGRHTTLNHNKQPSADSGLDLYDSPPKVRTMPEPADQQDYDVPRTDYDTPKSISATDTERTLERQKSRNMYDMSKNICCDKPDPKEHDIDDVYDVPPSNAPVRSKVPFQTKGEAGSSMFKGDSSMLDGTRSLLSDMSLKVDPTGVYDIPPQVTRDSMLSSKSESSDGMDDKRLSICSVDSRSSDIPIYDELPLDLDAAMDLMVKLQQDVQRATTKLSSFVSSVWRTKNNLEPNIYAIKLASNGVKNSLDEFLAFAQGTLANSARLPDSKLINKLHKHLHPLQQTLVQVKGCLKNLEESNWQLASLVTEDASKNDDLGTIATVSKDLTVDVRRLVSLIHGNSPLLFKRASDIPGYMPEPSSSSSVETCSAESKPPIQPKPQLPPKPGGGGKPGNLQHRPLPPPPPKERPLPPTPSDKKSLVDGDKRISGEFQRNSDDFHRYSAEFKRLSMELKNKQIENKEKDLVEEYDYVHLEARDVDEQMKRKNSSELRGDVHEMPVRDPSLPAKTSSNTDTKTMSDNHIIPTNIGQPDSDMEKVIGPVNIRYESPKMTQTVTPTLKLDPNDKQVLFFYSGQLETHSTLLMNAVDAFFACIEKCQGPKVFISHSKFVVVSAHKLVYIGDSLHKNLINNEIKNKIMHCANNLCNCLKAAVTTTKTAALQYPSVPAVQDMVDRVTDVSHAVYELKHVISQAAAL
ncbi:breast cancer anti-estrogen resistance protein 1-like [Pecten maximus]|uniref:breast cancer anti-estrogen resistance protein 1-like n=1 Tax=Pecten maximus TaxID=6579 RepID=UPI0014580235|nr:breast cancer anti-estrogen resistance protein 1-like [Pecten maximus]XP_033753751.1 breast cancer anti-estrogen resistance protein 1-like [Pecten maximus]XP_033753752.1 breast cancer anti-estrogen resistance protein 1-like [Pecten maximus]